MGSERAYALNELWRLPSVPCVGRRHFGLVIEAAQALAEQ
jgi:hypothetical protein